MILGYSDLEWALQEGHVVLKDFDPDVAHADATGEARPRIESCSFNLRTHSLWVLRDGNPTVHRVEARAEGLTQKEFERKHLMRLDMEGGVQLDVGDRLFWKPIEQVAINDSLFGYITTRSSAARDGFYVQNLRYFRNSVSQMHETQLRSPLCFLKVRTNVKLYEGDSIAQLFVNLMKHDYLRTFAMRERVDSLEMPVWLDGKPQKAKDLQWSEGLVLHRDDRIKVYNGKRIDSNLGPDRSYAFDDVRLPSEGLLVDPKTFFLSAAREEVQVPDGYVGYVVENDNDRVYKAIGVGKGRLGLRGSAHPRAPIVLGRNQWTFEEWSYRQRRIDPGTPVSELLLEHLRDNIPPNRAYSRFHEKSGVAAGDARD